MPKDSSEAVPGERPMWLLGAGVGVFTVLWFTALHQFLISNIWFSFIPMVVAGAICGACLAWNYEVLFGFPSVSAWVRFVGLQLSALLLLGVASVAIFDPVVPMAVLVAANEPPTELIQRALPLTGGFVLAAAALTSLLWGRTLAGFGASLLSSLTLFVLLGLNVSALGLVEISTDSLGVVGEFLGLIALIMAGYGIAFVSVAHRRFFDGHPLRAGDRGSGGT